MNFTDMSCSRLVSIIRTPDQHFQAWATSSNRSCSTVVDVSSSSRVHQLSNIQTKMSDGMMSGDTSQPSSTALMLQRRHSDQLKILWPTIDATKPTNTSPALTSTLNSADYVMKSGDEHWASKGLRRSSFYRPMNYSTTAERTSEIAHHFQFISAVYIQQYNSFTVRYNTSVTTFWRCRPLWAVGLLTASLWKLQLTLIAIYFPQVCCSWNV